MATKEELVKILYDFQKIRSEYKQGAELHSRGSNKDKRKKGERDQASALNAAENFIRMNPILQVTEDEINDGKQDQLSLHPGFELADMDKYIVAIEKEIKDAEE